MDIVCPNCATAYRVPDALVLTRKPVRCAACGTRWVPELPEEALPAPPAADDAPPAMEPSAPEADAKEPPPAAPLPRSIGAPPEPEPESAPVTAPMSIGPDPAEMLNEDGTLTPRPAAPPPLATPRWMPGAPRRVRGGALLPMAWAGSVLALVVILLLLFLYSEAIATAWPPFGWVARLFGG
ncbi:zinc-ribbon domain-containing protein [Roseococcus suduntuyensis]|uniref:Putative Zn finger-like uncharacterized protein n=1 Tax=Roseococcus suduntuyensis TaxID=455361 RepID=A0A840AGV9_9PROT|nr:zinc-ribbon domain-containing protein [Roseococcus suduntuyensis]MBB3900247.1 putative Zn finger-like uncharacterized protein [Roseococcus suduntuyensis]